MNALVCKCALVGLSLVPAVGCEVPPEPIALDTAGVTPALDYSDLQFVLDKVVASDGLLIAEALEEHSQRLDAQLKLLAVTGPQATPALFASADERIAYWYNARAAWAMKLALVCKCPKKLRRGELMDRAFPLDGRTMTVGEIDGVLAACEDWRVLVSSPGVTLLRSALPDRHFTALDVRSRIARRIGDLVDDQKRLVIDVGGRRILIPPVLWRYRETLIEDYNRTYRTEGANLTTALLRYVDGSAQRRLQDAVGYRPVLAGASLLVALFEE